MRRLLALLAAVAAAEPRSAHAMGEVRVVGPRFVDGAGAVVVLRGINVAGDSKVPPFRPAADAALFDPLPGFGLNAVRLLFTWEAYEPSPGQYDESYLDYYVGAARAAAERGLYVIVDFHQDAFSRYALGGCGEGAPAWAIDPAFPPATPDNGPACESWGIQMVQDNDLHALFASFFADVGGVRTAYLAMVSRVAEALANEPGVIGFDLMNEPWSDDEASELAPFHADGVEAIRAVSPDAVFFVSPRAFTSSGAQTELPPPAFDNAAYSPHFYDGGVLLFDSWSGLQPDEAFGFMTSKASEWNTPLFLGEFGAPAGTERGLDYVDMLYDRLDEGFFSSAHWVYTPGWTPDKKDGWNLEDLSIVDDGGNLRDNFRVRPHPRRVAGEPVRFSVTHDPPTLELAWEHDPALGDTVAFVPWDAWLGGIPSVEPKGAECSIEGDLLVCASAAMGPASVTVRRGEAPVPAPGGCSAAPGARSGWVGLAAVGALAAAASRRCRQKGARRGVSLGRANTTGSTTTKP